MQAGRGVLDGTSVQTEIVNSRRVVNFGFKRTFIEFCVSSPADFTDTVLWFDPVLVYWFTFYFTLWKLPPHPCAPRKQPAHCAPHMLDPHPTPTPRPRRTQPQHYPAPPGGDLDSVAGMLTLTMMRLWRVCWAYLFYYKILKIVKKIFNILK